MTIVRLNTTPGQTFTRWSINLHRRTSRLVEPAGPDIALQITRVEMVIQTTYSQCDDLKHGIDVDDLCDGYRQRVSCFY
jgi:hypothetical protein